MAGIVECKALVLHGAAPATNMGITVYQQVVFFDMVSRAQSGRPSADDDALDAARRRLAHCIQIGCRCRCRSRQRRVDRRHRFGMRRGMVDQRSHVVDRAAPGCGSDDVLHARAAPRPQLNILGQSGIAGGNETGRIVGNTHDIPIRFRHIGDTGTDDRQLRGHVFKGLGRTDEAGRLVEGERQQAKVPTGQKIR